MSEFLCSGRELDIVCKVIASQALQDCRDPILFPLCPWQRTAAHSLLLKKAEFRPHLLDVDVVSGLGIPAPLMVYHLLKREDTPAGADVCIDLLYKNAFCAHLLT